MQFTVMFCNEDLNMCKEIFKGFNTLMDNLNIISSNDHEEILNQLDAVNLIFLSTTLLNKKQHERVLKSNLPIIYMSENIKHDNIAKYINVLDYINKPIDSDEVGIKIKQYMKIHNKELKLQNFIKAAMDASYLPNLLIQNNKVIFANELLLALLQFESIEQLHDEIKEINELFSKKNNHLYKEINSTWFENSQKESNTNLFLSHKNKEQTYNVKTTYLNEYDTYVVYLRDVTKEIEHETQITNILYTDDLTKLENRTKLIHDLRYDEKEIVSLAVIDINSFKEINDFYGHKTGDHILKELALIIVDYIKPYSHMKLYKFPADIYCISNTSNNKEEFTDVVRKTIDTIEKKVFVFDQYEIDTRVTAGISFSTKNNKLITADLALQAAKKDHKDYLVFYDELDNLEEYKNNMIWTKKLKTALLKDNIIVYYQPLVNNLTLKVEKYECLVRMIDEESIISPFFFLDISKKSNQYHKITRSVIQKSFKEFENLDFEFSVNISYEDIENQDFLLFIKEMFKLYDVSNKVVFEILEDEGIKNYTILANFINEVKAMGCKVAIDDFGSGYSNFEHLLKMNIDYLKIDASLVKNIVNDENSYKVTKTIIDFAKSLNLKTIAEYVENKDIYHAIKDLGADYSQGYYFSAPLKSPTLYSCKDKENI
ncbi:MAG: EAL domain-containing protein [Candidatus Marinarcus sp.]|uniref:EAL domain-containing protein n=1 Tax=Candidatus Marinarcus sp. TaxID=3100987 RepID=UPI003AFF61AC